MRLVTGIYTDAEKANRAVDELIEAEFDADEISLVVTDSAGGHERLVEHDTGVAEGAVAGAALGAALGALVLHAEDLREGAVLIGVPAEGERHEAAREIFQRTGATRVRG